MATINLTQLKKEKEAKPASSFNNAPTIVLNKGKSSVETPRTNYDFSDRTAVPVQRKTLQTPVVTTPQTTTVNQQINRPAQQDQYGLWDNAGYVVEQAGKGLQGGIGGLVNAASTFLDKPLQTINAIGSFGSKFSTSNDYSQYDPATAEALRQKDAEIEQLRRQMYSNLDENFLDPIAQKGVELGAGMIAESQESNYDRDKLSMISRFGGDVAKAVGGMAPSIAASVIATPFAGAATASTIGLSVMGTGAYGQSLQQALNDGASYDDAVVYGLASAGVEIATEKLFGGIPFFGEGAVDDVLKEWMQAKLGTGTGKKVVEYLVDSIGEGAEEYISEVAGEFLVDIYTDERKDKDFFDRLMDVQDDAFYSFLLGAVTGGVMGAPRTILQSIKSGKTQEQPAEVQTTSTEKDPMKAMINEDAKAEAQKIVETPSQTQFDSNFLGKGLKSDDPMIRYESQRLSKEATINSARKNGVDVKKATKIADYANKVGIRVEFKDLTYTDKKGKTVTPEGMYQNGVIYISPKTVNPMYQVFKHELTHYIEDSDSYQDFQNVIFSLYDADTLNVMRENLRRERNDIVDEFGNDEVRLASEIDKELTAILSQDKIFTDKKTIDQLAQKKPNIVQTVYRWIKNKLAVARGEMTAEEVKIMETAEKLYREALEDLKSKQAKERTAQQMAVIPVEDITKSQYDKAKDFIVPNSMYRRISDAVNTHAEGLKYKKLVLNLSDFDAIVLLKGDGYFKVISVKLGNNYVEPKRSKRKGVSRNGNSGDSGGNRRIYRFRDDGTEITGDDDGFSGEYQEENNRRDRTDNGIRNDKNRNRRKLSQSLNATELLKDSTKVGPFFDVNGKELTISQQKYFKDSAIRDDAGNLKVMYHGSSNPNITEFNKKYAKSSGYYGRGFYFADSESYVKPYVNQNGKVYETYLNIKNPVQPGTNNFTKKQIKSLVQEIADNEDYGLDNYGYGATVESIVNQLSKKKDDFSVLMDINSTLVGDFVETVRMFNEVNGTDFDGIVASTETVAFYPEQIKLTSNESPTSSKDVRYSTGLSADLLASNTDSDGRKLSENQRKFFKDTKVVDDEGNLQPVYHASPNAQFYVFDKQKASPESDMGAGFYFSNQETDAESNYSDETGPDIKNKIDRLADQLEYEDGFEDADYDERYEEAKRRIVTGKTKHEVYLNIKNPVYVGDNQTMLFTYDHLQEYADDFNDGEIYDGIEDDYIYNLTEDLYDILDDSGVQTVNGIVYDALMYGGIDLQTLKENLNNAYLEDYEGNLVANEVARKLVENLGYDGIIDTTVSKKFKGMGLDPDTVHYIAFNPNQIKEITNKNPSESDDIRFSRGLSTSELLGNSKDPVVRARYQMEKRIKGTFLFDSKANPRKLYDITSRMESEFNNTGKISAETRQELFNAAYNETLKNADITYKELPEFKQMISEDLNRAVTQYENTLIKERELKKFAEENDIDVSEVRLNPTTGFLKNVKPQDLPDKIISYKKLKASLKSDLINQVDKYAGGKVIDELIDKAAIEIVEDGFISSPTKFKIRQEMIKNGYSINAEAMNDNKELYDFIKSTKFNVPRGFGREIQDFDRTKKLLKTSTQDGQSIDKVYQELRSRFGEFFPDDLTNPADQYQQIADVMAELEPTRLMLEDSEQYNAEMRQYLEDNFTDRLEDFKNQVLYRSQKDYYDRAAKKQVAYDEAMNQVSEKISEKFFKENKDIDELQKSEHVIKSASIEDLSEVIAKIQDRGALSKTLAQNLDAMANGDVMLRAKLSEIFEKPLREAKKTYVTNQKRVLNDVYKRIVTDLGIKMGSKESAAMMWYGEGQKQLNKVKGKVESDKLEFTKYTLDDLKKDFPKTWQNIVEADKIMRKYYDEYVDRINESLEKVYSESVLKESVNEKRTQLQKDIREAQERLEQLKAQRTGEVGGPDLEARINAQRKRITDLSRQFNNVAEDVYRNKRLKKRSDYYHHFQEVGFAENIQQILNVDSANNIANALAGISEYTKPKSKWEKFMQRRSNVARYEEDAIKGFLKYSPAAEYKISFDPYVAQMRGTIQDMIKLSDEANLNNAKAINWLTNYTNSLAGKTNPMDRWLAHTESGRTVLQLLNKVNSRVKANAVVGNLNSAVSQFYNLPNGLAVLTDAGGAQSALDVAKGSADYSAYAAKKISGQDVSDNPINQSVFLAERYIDSTIDQFDERIMHKPAQAATFLLTFGDQVVAEQLWFSAYEQGMRLGKHDPVAYADDLVSRSVAGRGIGEVPLMQQSQVVKLIAPFQVEVNNAYQLMKQLGAGALKDKEKLLSLAIMYGITWIMNEVNEALTGNRVGMDIFNAMQDAVENWDTSKNPVTNTFNAAGRLTGEILSNVPMGAQLAQMVVSDEYDREKLFGEADPSRYGTGNIGVNALMDPAVQLVTGQNVDWQSLVTNFATPMGGKQLNRFYKMAEDIGLIPRVDISTEQGLQASWKPGAYNDKGQLKYQIDTSDPLNVLKGFAFGTYATNEGKNYLDNEYSALSAKKTTLYETAVEAGADPVEFYNALREANYSRNLVDKNGESIDNSKAAMNREALERNNSFDEVKKLIESGQAEASDFGLNKAVFEWTQEEFNEFMKSLDK